ncbi:MAG: ATP-binding cassette domain-containing protein, partial [Clostridia bacterium]|nr:ATP-binding cassette domain-containing protein [Clostridia bacterium]
MNKLLELKNVSLTYQTKDDEIKAIENLSFSANEGEFISIIGPSGCGKTTVLSMIAGLIKPTAGKITLYGKDKETDLGIGYMLQKDYLFPWRTIEKNIYLPLEIKRKNKKESEQYVNSLLEKYGIKDFKKKYPDQLSGGMRQRVALIRTLVSNP